MIYEARFWRGPLDGQKRALQDITWKIHVAVLNELPCRCFSEIEPDEVPLIETITYRLFHKDGNILDFTTDASA